MHRLVYATMCNELANFSVVNIFRLSFYIRVRSSFHVSAVTSSALHKLAHTIPRLGSVTL